MARKTFISYKYSEAQNLRDEIIRALGEDATYYQGETSDSPDLTDESTELIRKQLSDMMYGTSVTIVILSPNLTSSKWIDWEIEYCLNEYSRQGRTSKTNGVIGVIQKCNGGYSWLVSNSIKPDGCSLRQFDTSKLYPIINNNRYKRSGQGYACNTCKSHDQLDGSYISLIDEEAFLANPNRYIENAYQKAENSDEFDLVKQR